VKDLTDKQLEIEALLKQEKTLMAEFYNRMSNTGLSPEAKGCYMVRFDFLSNLIKGLQASETVEWFAGLT
jgi:hypothetical protein